MILLRLMRALRARRRRGRDTPAAPVVHRGGGRTAVAALTRNVVRASFRNRTALFFTIGLAVLFMVIFGVIFGGNGPTLRIGVVDEDHGALAQSYLGALRQTSGLAVETGTLSDELDRLRRGRIVYLAVVGPGFSVAASDGSARVTVYANTESAQTASVAGNVVANVTAAFARQNHLGGTPGIVLTPARAASNDVSGLDFFLPAMIAYLVLQSGINFVAITLVDQRQRKVLRRYLATPLRPVQILTGNIIGGALTVIIQVVVLVVVGLTVFRAHTHGSPLLAALLVLVGTAAFVSIGFLVCSATRTSESARGLAAMIAFPMMFFSGVFIPLDAMPQVLQDIVHALPLTYLVEALHAVLNDGDGLTRTVALDLAVLAAWAVGCFSLAAWRFRWE